MPLETLQSVNSTLPFKFLEDNSVLLKTKLISFLIMRLSLSQQFLNCSEHHSNHHITARSKRINQDIQDTDLNKVFDLGKVCSNEQVSEAVSKFNLSF